VVECEHGRRRGIVEVDERRDAATVGHDRKLPLADGNDQSVVPGPVAAAVAKRDSLGIRDRLVEISHGRGGLGHALRRRSVERIVLGLHRPPFARVPEFRVALGHEPAHPCAARGSQERVGAFPAKPVRLRERVIQVLGEARIRQRRGLVDDRVRRRLEDGLAHRLAVEQVDLDRLCTELPDVFDVSRRSGGSDHLMSSIDQLRNRMVDDRGRTGLAEHAPVRQRAPRRADRRSHAGADPRPTRRYGSGARGAAGGLRRPGAARRARHAVSARAARVRSTRHLRHAVRRDRADRRPLARRGTAARQPRAPPSPGRADHFRCRPRHATQSRRRVSRSRTRGRLRGAARGPGPGRRAACGLRP
jgi:hypothetical protein